MISRRTLETAGFFTIAAALHVSAAAVMLPDRLERGAAAEAPPAALSAGGEEIRSMVEEWEAPPEVQTPSDIAAPQPQPQPEPAAQPEAPEPAPVRTAAAPLALPDPVPLQPNLPPPPEPLTPERVAEPEMPKPSLPEPIDPAQLDLPELQQLSTPDIKVASPLALEASTRPDRRPARQPRPAPEPEPRRAAASSPQPAPQAQAQAQPAQRAGEGGQSQRSSAGGGVSAETRASAMAQWTARIATCIGRQFSRVSGARGGRIVVNISIARNGRVQGATLISGTGDARVDGQVVRTAQRLRACPAAPAAVTEAVHTFTTPFTLQ